MGDLAKGVDPLADFQPERNAEQAFMLLNKIAIDISQPCTQAEFLSRSVPTFFNVMCDCGEVRLYRPRANDPSAAKLMGASSLTPTLKLNAGDLSGFHALVKRFSAQGVIVNATVSSELEDDWQRACSGENPNPLLQRLEEILQ